MKSRNFLRLACLVCGFLAIGLNGALAQEAALRIGQSFIIRVTGVPQEDSVALTQEYTIGDNGLIRLQYIEPVSAAGLKPSALARLIEEKFKAAEIYTKPTVNITASNADPTQYISVLGEVKLPQTVPFRPGMTLLDAIAACGGFTDFAKAKETKLVSGGQTRTLDLRKSGGPEAQTKLKVGDTITVPD